VATDRTQHVLDAIDGALADDEFPDAMRWSPAPETVDDAPAPFDGSLVWQPPQRYESEVAAAVPFSHQLHCSIVHEYLDRTPSCQCGALDRAALTYVGSRRPPDRLSFAPAGTPPAAVAEWTEIGHLVDEVAFMPWQVGLLAEVFGEQFPAVGGFLSRLFTVSAEALAQPAADAPHAEDPRARALRLRQHRTTGPRRPSGQQARPPRRLQ